MSFQTGKTLASVEHKRNCLNVSKIFQLFLSQRKSMESKKKKHKKNCHWALFTFIVWTRKLTKTLFCVCSTEESHAGLEEHDIVNYDNFYFWVSFFKKASSYKTSKKKKKKFAFVFHLQIIQTNLIYKCAKRFTILQSCGLLESRCMVTYKWKLGSIAVCCEFYPSWHARVQNVFSMSVKFCKIIILLQRHHENVTASAQCDAHPEAYLRCFSFLWLTGFVQSMRIHTGDPQKPGGPPCDLNWPCQTHSQCSLLPANNRCI